MSAVLDKYAGCFQHVARTQLRGGLLVSTLRWGVNGIEYETMILGGPRDAEWFRTDDLESALVAHARIVEELRNDADLFVYGGGL